MFLQRCDGAGSVVAHTARQGNARRAGQHAAQGVVQRRAAALHFHGQVLHRAPLQAATGIEVLPGSTRTDEKVTAHILLAERHICQLCDDDGALSLFTTALGEGAKVWCQGSTST